jgi:hypothetical protein
VKAEDHTQWVGAIVTNLQALETVLRFFLARLKKEEVAFPKPGDRLVKLTELTRYTPLSELVKSYNNALAQEEKQFEVDKEVIHIRNAIAHGRVVTTKELPFRLWKFGAHKKGEVEIDFCEELTLDWLKSKSALIDREKEKVIDCFNARDFEGLR